MGVLHLWEILSPAGQSGVKISDLSGKVLAVDLSAWILEFRKSEGSHHLRNLYIRNLFYRTLEFMKDGVYLIFVLDGRAPELKHEKLQKARDNNAGTERKQDPEFTFRYYLEMYSAECVKLIECLGIPWINSPGEAEEMCAYLNQKGIVDGCITKDSDFFCYGGKTIYRNLRKEKQLYVADLYKIEQIQSKLNYSRSDFVAMALLLGCDFNQSGVKNVGKEKVVTLFQTWRDRGLKALDRILGWSENKELDEVEQKSKNRTHKEQHCKKCSHTGNTKSHEKSGCGICKQDTGCNGSCDILCPCDWHREDRLLQEHKLEMLVRQRSRETTDFIPKSNKIIEEFLKPDLGIDVKRENITWRPIDLAALIDFLDKSLYMTQNKVIEVITPVFITSQLFQKEEDLMYTPIRIVRRGKQCGIDVYLVTWDKTDRNMWPMVSSVDVKVEKKIFAEKFPALAKQFEEGVSSKPKPPAGKRKQGPDNPVDDVTPIKKRPENKGPGTSHQKTTKGTKNTSNKTQPSLNQFFKPAAVTRPSLSQFFKPAPQTQPSLCQLFKPAPSVCEPPVIEASTTPAPVSQPAVVEPLITETLTIQRSSTGQSSMSQTKRELDF